MDTSVPPSAVFILDELGPHLIRRIWKQHLCPGDSWSPHLVGQLVTIGNKQLEKEGFPIVTDGWDWSTKRDG